MMDCVHHPLEKRCEGVLFLAFPYPLIILI